VCIERCHAEPALGDFGGGVVLPGRQQQPWDSTHQNLSGRIRT
jgi:hypothetical protein